MLCENSGRNEMSSMSNPQNVLYSICLKSEGLWHSRKRIEFEFSHTLGPTKTVGDQAEFGHKPSLDFLSCDLYSH